MFLVNKLKDDDDDDAAVFPASVLALTSHH